MKWDFEIVADCAAEAAQGVLAKVAEGELPLEVAHAISLRLANLPPERPGMYTKPDSGDWKFIHERKVRVKSRGSLVASADEFSGPIKKVETCIEMSVQVSYEDTPRMYVGGELIDTPFAPLSPSPCAA
jgi:hypothetical protein